MIMKKIFFTLAFLFVLTVLRAQQIPMYSQYMINDYAINPAFNGIRNYAEAKADSRYQWVGINDAPRTYILSLNGPIKHEKMGVGGHIFTDVVGPTRRNGVYGSYAYHVTLMSKLKLSLGLTVGLLQFAVDASKINMRESSDLALSNSYQSFLTPDASFGFLFYNDNLFAGATINQLINNKVKFFDAVTTNSSTAHLTYHAVALAGYRIPVGESFKIEPSAMVKYVAPVPAQIDGSLRFIYDDKYWLGLTYRTQDAIVATIGLLLNNNITFAYSYDYTTSNIKNYSSGTHEIMLGLRFITKRNIPPMIHNSGFQETTPEPAK